MIDARCVCRVMRLCRAVALALAGSTLILAGAARAEGLVTTHRLPARLASEAVSAAVARCAKEGYAETAVLVDADGLRQAVLRGDGAGSHTLDSAYDKAYTAASFKTDTSKLVGLARKNPGFSGLFTQLPHLILFGGGLVIKVDGETIGAAGAPGARLDEACARAGLDQISSQLK